MFPYRSLPVRRFELWMDARFDLPAPLAGGSARPPPASEVEKGCLLRAFHRLQTRIPFLCGLPGQRMPMLHGENIRRFWRALRAIGRLGDILRFLAEAFKTSLLAGYLSLKPPWERDLSSVRPARQPAPASLSHPTKPCIWKRARGALHSSRMPKDTPAPKERLALLRFEVICHLKTLRQEGLPLSECLRDASSRPWPEPDGRYYACRTLETW